MIRTRLALVSLVAAALAGPAAADDSGNFVVWLGKDTTSVEHYSRTASRVEVDQVGRAPRVLRRHFTYDLTDGAITHVAMVATPPGAAEPTQTIDASIGPDSARMQIRSGSAPVQNLSVAMPPGTLVVASSSPWSGYEGQIMKLVQGKGDSLRTTMYFLGASATDWLSLHQLGRDSVSIFNGHQDQFHVRVDKTGRILGVLPIAGTGKVGVERVASLDVGAMATYFASREQAGAGLGVLSPRDTVRIADAGGASLWVDYGRPGKRGRVIFGGVVPFGEVWRTGANGATQFKTDKPLDFGGTVVPAGFYTLWTIPSATGWKLIFNSETGEWGTAHKAEKDLYTIDMKVSTLSQVVERFTIGVESNAQGGVLNLDWDTTRASVAFTVKP
jgi:hypothetical protein